MARSRCFTLTDGEVCEGIALASSEADTERDDPRPCRGGDVIVIGTTGRLRSPIRITLPVGAVTENRVISVPSEEPGAIVKVARGTEYAWRLREAWSEAEWDRFMSAELVHRAPTGLPAGHADTWEGPDHNRVTYLLQCPACRELIGEAAAAGMARKLDAVPGPPIRILAEAPPGERIREFLVFVPDGASLHVASAYRTALDHSILTLSVCDGEATVYYPIDAARDRAASNALASI